MMALAHVFDFCPSFRFMMLLQKAEEERKTSHQRSIYHDQSISPVLGRVCISIYKCITSSTARGGGGSFRIGNL